MCWWTSPKSVMMNWRGGVFSFALGFFSKKNGEEKLKLLEMNNNKNKIRRKHKKKFLLISHVQQRSEKGFSFLFD